MKSDTFYQAQYNDCCTAIKTLSALRAWLITHSVESESILEAIGHGEALIEEFSTLYDIVIEEECTLIDALSDSPLDVDSLYDEGMAIIDGLNINDELETVFAGTEVAEGPDAAQKQYDALKLEFEQQFRQPIISTINKNMDFLSNIERD